MLFLLIFLGGEIELRKSTYSGGEMFELSAHWNSLMKHILRLTGGDGNTASSLSKWVCFTGWYQSRVELTVVSRVDNFKTIFILISNHHSCFD